MPRSISVPPVFLLGLIFVVQLLLADAWVLAEDSGDRPNVSDCDCR